MGTYEICEIKCDTYYLLDRDRHREGQLLPAVSA